MIYTLKPKESTPVAQIEAVQDEDDVNVRITIPNGPSQILLWFDSGSDTIRINEEWLQRVGLGLRVTNDGEARYEFR